MRYTITSISQKTLTMRERPFDDAIEAMAEYIAQITDPDTIEEYDAVTLMEEREEDSVILAACQFTESYKEAVKNR